ncbi:MAG: UDP-3-O-(3-hydroxymyristoyl)glucosamine N-acyltransferase [Limisphaerales bacterium]
MGLTIAEVAAQVRGEVIGDAAIPITRLTSADRAASGDLTFAENPKYFEAAAASAASGILVSESLSAPGKVLIKVPNVRIAVAQLLPKFFPPEEFSPGVHSTADIHPTAQIDPTAHVGAHCIVRAGTRIGPRCVLMGGNHLGTDCELAEEVRLCPNVVLYARTKIGKRVAIHASTVIGSDGYGYVFDQGRHRKVLQVGNVVIEDDVEIGANAAIDRAAFGSTIIGAGTKIDNLVHVAHNVVMGKHCLVMGQCGFAGSTQLGDYAVIASQSGIAGHLKLGRQATVGAKSGVMRDVADGETVLGIPAQPHKQMKRQWIAAQHLPELTKRLRDLEHQVQELKQLASGQPPSPP